MSLRQQGAIRHKLKQVVFRHLKREIQTRLKREPSTCTYNQEEQVLEHTLGICCHSLKEGSRICMDPDTAAKCTYYDCAFTKEGVKEEFRDFLSSATLAQIAVSFPDVAALMWVLQEDVSGMDWQDEDTEESNLTPEETFDKLVETGQVEAMVATKRRWWHWFFRWLR